MDGQLPQQIYTNKSNLPKFILSSLGILALGFILGFTLRPYLIPQKSSPALPNQVSIDPAILPISLRLLNNPVVDVWRGGVKGKIVKKDVDSFTLVDDHGNSISISDITPTGEKWRPIFFDKSANKQASYSAIPVGSTLSGEFFILKGAPDRPVGGQFSVQQ